MFGCVLGYFVFFFSFWAKMDKNWLEAGHRKIFDSFSKKKYFLPIFENIRFLVYE